MLVSVVVPIYKVEKYLDNCVKSIIQQSYSNIEIILVDDGSPDKCGQMCDEYANMDNRIVVIHKQNGGLSDARNTGIKVAKGEYITCIDSDDYVSKDYIEYLVDLQIKFGADISIAGFIKTQSLSCTVRRDTKLIRQYDSNSALCAMLYAKEFTTSAWGKLYKKELFDGVEYPIGKVSEDMFTTYKLISKANMIVCGERVCYFYVYRSNSILTSEFSMKHLDVIDALKTIRNDGLINTEQLSKAYKSQAISLLAEILEKKPPECAPIDDLWNESRRYLINVIVDRQASRRVRAMAFVMLFGKKMATKIIVKYYKHKWRGQDD